MQDDGSEGGGDKMSRTAIREYMALTRHVFDMPKSVQQSIPIVKISQDGIFQLEKETGKDSIQRYDKAYLFYDTNFVTMNQGEAEEFERSWIALLNSLNVSYKVLVMNGNRNDDTMQKEIFLKDRTGKFKEVADAYNEIIREKLMKGRCGIEQFRLFIVTCERQNYLAAADYFRTLETNLIANFNRLSSRIIPLDAEERLQLLHNFYRVGHEKEFYFHYLEAVKSGRDFRNDICPMSIMDVKDQYGNPDGKSLRIEDQYVRCLFAREFPSALSPLYIRDLSEVSFPCIITMDHAPIPPKVSRKRMYDLYMENGSAINKEQEFNNRTGNFSTDISFDKRKKQEKIELAMNLLSDNNEKMSYFGLYVVVYGKTYEELENNVLTITTISEGDGVELAPVMFDQLNAFHTCLPLGVRYCRKMRTIFSSNQCAFMPFNMQEVQDKGGLFYGINALTKNPIIGERKRLANGNGVILGETGYGKSISAKLEMGEVLVHTQDDVIGIDPHSEYHTLTDYFRGQFVDIGKVDKLHINPLDTASFEYYESQQAFLYDKINLMQTIVTQMKEDNLTSEEKSIVVRCTEIIFQKYFQNPKKENTPVIRDFYDTLKKQPEPEAANIAITVERFLSSALNVFDGQSNVDIHNRFVVFGLANLGEALFGVGMIVMLEEIRNRIARNFKKGIATWVYVDEFHVLTRFEASAQYLDKLWREIRKMGGLLTGIDQNFSAVLENKTVETMLSNSSYIVLLKQGDAEIPYIQRIMELNENEIDIVKQAPPGCGLVKWGDKLIPMECIIPKDNLLYQMYSTNFHETHKKAPGKKAIFRASMNLEADVRKQVLAAEQNEEGSIGEN